MSRLKRWHKVPDLFGEVTLTEKLDGLTVALHIDHLKERHPGGGVRVLEGDVIAVKNGQVTVASSFYRVWAQHRDRVITLDHDVAGVAAWAQAHGPALVHVLGEGIHLGEWWGHKVNRGYDVPRGVRCLSLFNTERWHHIDGTQVPGLHHVPVLWQGQLDDGGWEQIGGQIAKLREDGSVAAQGYQHPQGVVLYHKDGDVVFKYIYPDERGRRRRPNGDHPA